MGFSEIIEDLRNSLSKEGKLKTKEDWDEIDAELAEEQEYIKKRDRFSRLDDLHSSGFDIKEFILSKDAKIIITREKRKPDNIDILTWKNSIKEYYNRAYFKYVPGSSIFIMGDIGTGKTLMAHKMAHYFYKQGKSVALVEDHQFKSDASEIAKGEISINKYFKPFYLALDDGLRTEYRKTTIELLNEVIIGRIARGLITFITSEHDIRNILLDTTVDRMCTKFVIYKIEGQSKRKSLKIEVRRGL